MLELKNITKEYKTGGEVVHALKGINLAFRESEFVSILGPSGCGKTTMLNILGGLDQYTSGDLVIDGISTKEYKDADWDAYRNDTIGFVFQSYNLISHQTVLANVELALTLSGVSASERRKRAIAALEQVGLGNQLNKKPAQMSGGQMQRVAIARALINDPDIILADEPTGALDSETSLQIMGILKEISARKLVIMVTHNPELAEQYSTRIVRVSDGLVVSDTDPFVPGASPAKVAAAAASGFATSQLPTDDSLNAASDSAAAMTPDSADASALADSTADASATPRKKSRRASRRRNKSMSMLTALHLSTNNLMTKKARTLLTAFAGSIGIIGIALILSVSSGFQDYIDQLEEDTLSSYPLQIQSETADMTSMITAFASGKDSDSSADTDKDKSNIIHEQQIMSDMLGSIGSNDLTAFKEYLDSNEDKLKSWTNDYEYFYGISPSIYSLDDKYGVLRVSPGSIMQSYMNGLQKSMVSYANTDVFFQMMNNQELLSEQFKVVAGEWPQEYNELVLVLDSPDQLNDYIVYTLGMRDPQELKDMINEVMKGNEVKVNNEPLEWTYDYILGKEFALVNACDTFRRNSSYDVWEDMSDDDAYMKDLIKKSEKLKIVGIVCPKDKSGATAMSNGIGYLPSLTEHMIEYASESDIVKIQLAEKNVDVFSGKSFEDIRNKTDQGLGFGDMISIDQDKLKNALGGDIDPNAMQKAIENNAQNALKDLNPADTIKSIMTDAATGNAAMLQQIMTQQPDETGNIPFDNDTIDKALGDNLNSGAHKDIVNKLMRNYADTLKAKVTDSGSAPLMQLASELPQELQSFMTDENTTNAVTAYAEGIALQKTAQNVPQAIGGVAQAMGEQFNVDPSGIADAFTMKMDEDELTRLITAYMAGNEESSYESNLRTLGYANLKNPTSMAFYLKDFDSKEAFLSFIDSYNEDAKSAGNEDLVISYTDITGVMMKSVKTITNAVSYVLIAFVAISLVVSSIMIGVITYISVLERTKEIGILRAIGASKKDISRIFNAETIIVGLCAGVIGIGVSLLLLIPINKILLNLTKIASLKAVLPPGGAIALILISIFLTFIAGLIPSGMAARKDPVVALRTE